MSNILRILATHQSNLKYEFQLRKKIVEKAKDGTLRTVASAPSNGEGKAGLGSAAGRKRGRWDQTVEEHATPAKKITTATTPTSWEQADVRTKTVVNIMV